jgi:hypothetical protein
MTPTTEAVKQAAQQAVSAQPDADTRTQVVAALRALGIEPHTRTEYNRVKKHVVSARNPKPRGGARPGSGRPVTLPADRYIGTVTATPGTDDAQRAHKLLSGYGSWCEDAQAWEVHLTPPQARYMLQRHGDKLTLERVG